MTNDGSKALLRQAPTSLAPISRLAERTLAERVEREEQALVAARTLVVGPGGYATISEAVAAARDGDTVLVRPGRYREHVEIKASMTVRGDGDRERIVVTWDGPGHVVTVESPSRLTGISVLQGRPGHRNSGGADWDDYSSALFLHHPDAGRTVVAGCSFTAAEWAGVFVSQGSSAEITDCLIHDCGESGVYLRDADAASDVTIVGNEISACNTGVWIASRRNPAPTIRANFIHDNRIGIGSNFSFGGVIDGNRFEGNRIDVKGYASPDTRDTADEGTT
jgi:nitrous oxidase accessory protein NosD